MQELIRNVNSHLADDFHPATARHVTNVGAFWRPDDSRNDAGALQFMSSARRARSQNCAMGELGERGYNARWLFTSCD